MNSLALKHSDPTPQNTTLPDTLSAIRKIILDLEEIPADQNDRYQLYSKLFGTLPQTQVEDLARINPSQIQTYTKCIFRGHVNTLTTHFRLSLAAIRAHWPEKFDEIAFVRSLHSAYPWQSYTTHVLALNFQRFVSTHLIDIQQNAPELLSFCQFELKTLEVKRFKNNSTAPKSLSTSELLALSLHELLDLNWRTNQGIASLELEYDVLELWQNSKQSMTPSKKKSCLVGSRNSANIACWTRVASSALELINSAQTQHVLYDLAEALVDSKLAEEDEQQQCALAINSILTLVGAGAITIPASQLQSA